MNRSHPVPENFSDGITFVELMGGENTFISLEEEAARAYLKLQQFLLDSGLPIELLSGYRTAEKQQRIWDESLESNGAEYTARYVATPGFSEHQTGLAMDVMLYDQAGNVIADNDAPEYERMLPVLHRFGFILRYPEGREEITGYGYEPWHIRYVGIPAAQIIWENNWTLEEYTKNIAPP